MKKVTEIYFEEDRSKLDVYCTGLVLILEDGTRVETTSTDVVGWKITKPAL